MEKKSTKIILTGLILLIIWLGIINILDFKFVDFYFMIIMLFFLVKYIFLLKE